MSLTTQFDLYIPIFESIVTVSLLTTSFAGFIESLYWRELTDHPYPMAEEESHSGVSTVVPQPCFEVTNRGTVEE